MSGNDDMASVSFKSDDNAWIFRYNQKLPSVLFQGKVDLDPPVISSDASHFSKPAEKVSSHPDCFFTRLSLT